MHSGFLVFVVALSWATTTARADDAKLRNYGRHLAQECTACHSQDGHKNGIPSIVGWDTETFVKTLGSYKTGTRSNPVMASVAGSLDEDQMKALAAYWATVPQHPDAAPKSPKKK